MNLVKEKYHDSGQRLLQKSAERDGITVNHETLHAWMMEVGLWCGKKRKTATVHQRRTRRSRF